MFLTRHQPVTVCPLSETASFHLYMLLGGEKKQRLVCRRSFQVQNYTIFGACERDEHRHLQPLHRQMHPPAHFSWSFQFFIVPLHPKIVSQQNKGNEYGKTKDTHPQKPCTSCASEPWRFAVIMFCCYNELKPHCSCSLWDNGTKAQKPSIIDNHKQPIQQPLNSRDKE